MRDKKFTHDSSKEVVISLHYPLQLADRELPEVTMRRPKVGDILDYDPMSETNAKLEVKLFASLCGLKAEELHSMDAVDYARLQEQFMRFRADPKS